MKRTGPKLSIVASCNGCEFERSEHYVAQGDSGFKVSCAHAAGGRIGDTTWDTPSWCPFIEAAKTDLALDIGRGVR